MICPAPRVITFDIGRPPTDRFTTAEPLCIAEMLSLIEELADLGVERIRLLLHNVEALDDFERLIHYARGRRCKVTAVCRAAADAASITAIAAAKPDAIAVPLHSHTADIHRAVAGEIDWSQSIYLARTVRETGMALEIETTITSGNALPLLPLSEVVESLHAASWHLDFSRARLSDAIATSAATALVHIAASGRMRVSVHELPLLRGIVRRHAAGLPPATPPLVVTTGVTDTMHVSWSGDVQTGGVVVGNVRAQTLDTIQELSRARRKPRLRGGAEIAEVRGSLLRASA